MAHPAAETETSDPAPTMARQRKPRIILRYGDDGKPDIASLDGDSRAALASAFREQVPIERTDPALVGMVLVGIGSLEGAMLATRLDLPIEDVKSIVGPMEPMKSLLADAGAKVIDKHNLMGRWGDEIALCALLVSWQASVLQSVRAMAAARRAEEKRERDDHAARGSVGQTTAREVNPGSVVSGDIAS